MSLRRLLGLSSGFLKLSTPFPEQAECLVKSKIGPKLSRTLKIECTRRPGAPAALPGLLHTVTVGVEVGFIHNESPGGRVMTASLPELVASSRARIAELRKSGDLGALISASEAAADAIEQRVVGAALSDADQEALLAVKRFTYNAAADCWPGWSVSDEAADPRHLEAAFVLAQRSLALVRRLALGPLQEATGLWLVGAFELAMGKRAEASATFATARDLFVAAKAPGLALLTEGYVVIAHGGEGLESVCARIAAGGFEDGAEWVEQLRTASTVFAKSIPGA